jgi:ATP-dependent RNA helicase HelY
MAANLVRRYPPDAAHHLLNLSFAQYRADRDIVRLEAQLEKSERLLADYRNQAECELGDVAGYRDALQEAGGRSARRRAGEAIGEVLGRMRLGDVLLVPGGKSAGPAAVVSIANRRGGGVRLGALTPDRRYLALSARDFPVPPPVVGHVDLPSPYAPRNPGFQRAVAEALGHARLRRGGAGVSRRADGAGSAAADAGGAGLRGSNAASGLRGPNAANAGYGLRGPNAEYAQGEGAGDHPVASCPDRRRHLRALERAERLEKDVRRLERRIRSHTESLARQFDRVLRVLEAWGYVDDWELTAAGDRLTRIYHECDLLVAEALGGGLFDGLDPTAVAALASAVTYESRGRAGAEGPTPWFPTSRVKKRWTELERLATELNQVEDDAGLPLTRRPDAGFFAAAYGWAAGEGLAEVIADEELSGGDFVRNIKQLIDLLRQLGDVAPERDTATAAREAADRLFRGVVSASSVVGA